MLHHSAAEWPHLPPTQARVCAGARSTLLLLSALTTQNNPNDYQKKKKKFAWKYTNLANQILYWNPGPELRRLPEPKQLIYAQIWMSLLLWLEARRYLGGWRATANSIKICFHE